LVPSALTLGICISFVHFPLPRAVRKLVDAAKSPFERYMSVHEAEALSLSDEKSSGAADLRVDNNVPLWRTLLFVFVGLLACLAWLADGSFILATTTNQHWEAVQRFLLALTWLYATIRPIARPTATPPYDLFSLYLLHIAGGVLQLGGYLFEHNAAGTPLPSTVVLVGLSVNLAALVGLVTVIMGMPLALPSHLVNKEDIVSPEILIEAALTLLQGFSVSPEDYTSLWGWVRSCPLHIHVTNPRPYTGDCEFISSFTGMVLTGL
jgi:hypothetical protein